MADTERHVDVTYENLRVLIGNAVFDRYETAVADALIERPHVVRYALGERPVRRNPFDDRDGEGNLPPYPYNQATVWSCSHCGPCLTSKANWCDMGCGRDYNRMTEMALFAAPQKEALTVADDWTCESCGADANVELPDGSHWCRACDGAAKNLGYDDLEVVEG